MALVIFVYVAGQAEPDGTYVRSKKKSKFQELCRVGWLRKKHALLTDDL